MIDMNRAVYLNDLGILNAMGSGKQQVLDHFLQGIAPGMLNDSQWLMMARQTVVGQVSAELPELPEHFVPWDSRVNRLLLAALQQLESSLGSFIERYGKQRIGVVIGTSTSGIAEGETYIADYQAAQDAAEQQALAQRYLYRKQEMGAPALFVSKFLDLGGPCITVSTACSSSAKVFATARNWLTMNLCDVVIAGGADSLCRLTLNGFDALGLVSDQLCRPFQQQRKGINIGEAAALFLLSREPGRVRLAAVGESSDAYHISAPQPEGKGALSAMQAALYEADIKADRIRYINLHGTATPANDQAESAAVHQLFGEFLPCSSSKPLTGHTLGAAGATELGLCWLLMQDEASVLPRQVNFDELDPSLARIALLKENMKLEQEKSAKGLYMLSNSFAFGGSNVSVLLEANNQLPDMKRSYTLQELLPHRSPMLLLDELLLASMDKVQAQVNISADSAFFSGEANGVPVWVAVEYMAQAIGIWEGLRQKMLGKELRAAFLLGVRKFQSESCTEEFFYAGEKLLVEISPSVFDKETRLGVFDCAVSGSAGRWTARINAFSPEDPLAFIDHPESEETHYAGN
jgi:3-oxoacyl-[acyl-carrier-protein] synthase-1